MIRTIHLYGSLADNKEEQTIQLDVDTPYLLFSGLRSQVPGFDYRIRNCGQSIRVFKSGEKDEGYLAPTDFTLNLGDTTDIHIISEIEGGGIEAGLIAAYGAFWGSVAYFAIQIAVSMVVSAIASALAPKPNTSGGSQSAEQKPSFMYRGVVNVTEQGYPVPLAYGLKVLVGSTVISVDADTVQL